MPLPLLLALLACQGPAKGTGDTAEAPDPPWPEWTFRPWVWEDESTQDSALELVHGYLDRDLPVGVLIIDSPWETGYDTLEWDPERFPDPQAMIDELHGLGVRVLLWIVPGMNTDVPLYDEAAERGWFMQRDAESGPAVVDWWKGEGSLLDYFSDEAVDWWHGLLDRALAYGIDGWKCDGLDYYALLADYSPALGREVERPEYSERYYRDFFDYSREFLGGEAIITARPVDNYGAGIGGEAVAFAPRDLLWAGWVGDQDASFDGLRAALDNEYWSADYGYVAFGSDIGGYREDGSELGRSSTLFVRWVQLGAFSPVMENGGGGEHRPWAFGDEVLELYRRYARLHEALRPYLDAEGARAFAEGRSLLEFQDRETYGYLLGPDLFVLPVLEESGRVQGVLPEGEWRPLFEPDELLPGGTGIEETFPLERYPVYVRDGSSLLDELRAALED